MHKTVKTKLKPVSVSLNRMCPYSSLHNSNMLYSWRQFVDSWDYRQVAVV